MIAWLDIDGGQDGFVRSIYRDASAAALVQGAQAHRWLTGLGAIQRPLSIPGIAPAPTANLRATLDNASGEVTCVFGPRPPMRAGVRAMTPEGAIFAGIITGVSLGVDAGLDIEAGLDRPLSDTLPLRQSTVWGGYRDVRTLPWCYGAVTVTPIQYSDDQRVFLLADHPIAGVDAVTRDNVATPAFEWANDVDSTGHACAFIELAEPLGEGEQFAVSLRGRMHPDTGRLLSTPAEIVHDVLAHLAGAPVSWADLDDYRTETAAIALGGVIDDATATIRATLDRIIQSAGGAWSAGMPGIAITWPPQPDPTAPAFPVTPLTAEDMSATTGHDGIVTRLRVLFHYDHAAARHRRAIQLEAPAAVREYGVLEREWDAGWLRSTRDAEALGQRMLAWLARPRWRLTWQRDFADIATGAWADIDHPRAPLSGRHRVIDATLDLSAPSLTCTVEGPVGTAPEIVTTRLSTAFDPVVPPGVTIDIGKDEIIYTVRGDDGRVIPGAIVTLNGTTTRIADAGGRVSFPVQRGRQHLLIQAPGRAPSEVIVTV